ncbi:hypothetical protein G6F42_019266 [Rhizopus arrhizus]|uniref:ISXO2-like transposase domain-containing protein n=2 Tax=Rhizopus oryzae TaxID=64495 RepID=A0A9P6XVI7_RHIOR|nr:hypothetical protein G6F20_012324 [Rhizopus arrhizus]KAG1092176.1 hypothetical protein G6F42_019266 [Rhizopus arrhizus]KAG1533463.1 hypothetical protein G6F51_012601 [Rhizopus arrhizus]
MRGPTWRASRNQYQFRCYNRAAHATEVSQSVTKSSMFYRKRCDIRITLKVIFRLTMNQERFSTIYRDLSIDYKIIAQLYRDLIVVFESDLLRHNPIMLGGPGVDHVQIDESKFGKRKYHRGHRVEGVWVLGMVEAIALGTNRVVTISQANGVTETRLVPQFKAGRRFLCTVPNRNARTLIPIIRKYVVPGTTIRTDGWRAYSGLHPRERYNARTGALQVAMMDSEQHIYRHQVVNHSLGFATEDQVHQNNTRGMINTNIIEGLWADVKREMQARHRTKLECPYRLMEYLWRYENRNQIWRALVRGLGEVSFPDMPRQRNRDVEVENYQLITEEEGSEEVMEGDPTDEMNNNHEIDIDIGEDTDTDDIDNDPDYQAEVQPPPLRRRRLNRRTDVAVVIEDESRSLPSSDNDSALSVEQATSRLLEVVRNRDIDNFQTASEALYNAMIAEQNTSNAT